MPIEKKSKNISRSFRMKTMLPARGILAANLMTVSSQSSCYSECLLKNFQMRIKFTYCQNNCP